MVVDATQVDPWQTGTGMADNIDGVMTECFFGVDEKYNADAVLFCSTLVDPQTGEPITTIKYSVGEGWETNQDGSQIVHPTKQQVNNSSRFGFFIDRIARPTTEIAPKNKNLTSPAGKANGLGLGATLAPRGTPFQAKTFEGLIFHWDLHKGATLGKDDAGGTVYKDVLYPTKFLGVYGKSAAAAPASANRAPQTPAQQAPQATAAASNGADAGDLDGTIPVPLLKKLTLRALEVDLKTFLKEVGRNPEVLALPDATMGYVMSSSAEGFHAQKNA